MKRKRTKIYEAQVGRNKTRAVRNVKVFFYIFILLDEYHQ